MTDKVQKIREEVERLKSQLVRGACASQMSMETRCKEESYNEVLAILDSLQEEPVSIWHDASEEPDQSKDLCAVYSNGKFDFFEHVEGKSYNNYWTAVNQARTEKGILLDKWAYLDDLLNLSNVERIGKDWKEPVSEDLEKASKEWLRPQLDVSYKAYGEGKQMELTRFDGYAMLDAIEFGAKWQKQKDALTWEDIPKILSICENLKTSWWFRDNEQTKQIGEQPFWEEVLKRFKERKKK